MHLYAYHCISVGRVLHAYSTLSNQVGLVPAVVPSSSAAAASSSSTSTSSSSCDPAPKSAAPLTKQEFADAAALTSLGEGLPTFEAEQVVVVAVDDPYMDEATKEEKVEEEEVGFKVQKEDDDDDSCRVIHEEVDCSDWMARPVP